MMIISSHNDPYTHSDSYIDFEALNEWQKLSNYLNWIGHNPFRPLMTFTTEEKYNTSQPSKKETKIRVKEKDMDIERLKTYTTQLKELETKLAELEPQVEEKKVDLDAILQQVKGGFIHDGVKRSMDYNIRMNQLFYDKDKLDDIPGKKEAIEAMSMSYMLSEKFNEWEKVAIPYTKCKNQLKYLKRKYADIKDTLVQALQCFEDNMPEETN